MLVASLGDGVDAALGRAAEAAAGAPAPPKESLRCLIPRWEEPESLANSSK